MSYRFRNALLLCDTGIFHMSHHQHAIQTAAPFFNSNLFVRGGNSMRMVHSKSFATFRRSIPILETVMPLPGLGDSISEGTIVQWLKNVGDIVEVDDVLAVIETDKISIDIRSPHRGLLTHRHASVDQQVSVGAPLCTIDEKSAPKLEVPPELPRTQPPKPEDTASFAAHMSGVILKEEPRKHIPLIHFKGKRSKAKTGEVSSSTSSMVKQGPQEKSYLKGTIGVRVLPGVLTFDQIVGGSQFGRPTFSLEEIEAIESGGASCAPPGMFKNQWMSA